MTSPIIDDHNNNNNNIVDDADVKWHNDNQLAGHWKKKKKTNELAEDRDRNKSVCFNDHSPQ